MASSSKPPDLADYDALTTSALQSILRNLSETMEACLEARQQDSSMDTMPDAAAPPGEPDQLAEAIAAAFKNSPVQPVAPAPADVFTTTQPNKRRRTARTAAPEPLLTANQFTVLTPTTAADPDETDQTDAATSTLSNAAPLPDRPHKVPPFVLRDKTKWTPISKSLPDRNVHWTNARNSALGINIYTATEAEYRKLYKALDELNAPFHTYQLHSEKSLRVVLRGVPQHFTDQEITEDLTEQQYPPIKITRLNGRDNRPAPLITVEIDKTFKSIYNLTEYCGLTITVAPKNTHSGQRQCHRCQTYGHTQPHCHSDYRCMKCAGAQSTHLCEKPRTTAAQCANCNGEHTSNFTDCPKNPNRFLPRPATPTASSNLRQIYTPQPGAQTFTYSSAITGATNRRQPTDLGSAAPNAPSPDAFTKILAEMLGTLLSINAAPYLITDFVVECQALYNIYIHKTAP